MAILVTSDEVHNRIESGEECKLKDSYRKFYKRNESTRKFPYGRMVRQGEYSTYQSSIVNNDHTQDHASDIQSKDTPLSKSYTLFSEIQLLKQEYGDHLIYEGLKNDKSKAMIEQSLFQKLDYQKQLGLLVSPICTDNYFRLSNLDKDLLSIVHNLTKNNPPSHHELAETITLLHKWILDPEIRTIFEPIYACTSRIYDLDTPSTSQGMQLETYRSGIKITSPVNKNISIAAIITTVYMVDFEDCNPGSD
ncbi:hypothetical protein RhiirA4_472468 [Rhizophagus irregularis]|uniref:Uncharacterized protein n=1 Tax=Rhizophagus irregularis TaxID=588596 RepID=A0A2I1H519_9GLOM|nr:hypothetical protein RhiirA4_472468 [Rhizophagus irregularis]